MKRVFLIVLDSCGIGQMPDAPAFGDYGVNTLRSCAGSKKFSVPNLLKQVWAISTEWIIFPRNPPLRAQLHG